MNEVEKKCINPKPFLEAMAEQQIKATSVEGGGARLVELNPRWVPTVAGRTGMGVSFDCPNHRKHRLVAMFKNPIDGGEPSKQHCKDCDEVSLWQRTGETFDLLTLSPSIDATNHWWPNCWHGHIQNGEIVGGVADQALSPAGSGGEK